MMFTLFFLLFTMQAQTNFLEAQLKFDRVQEAYTQKIELIKANLQAHQVQENQLNVILVALKEEQELQIFGKNQHESSYRLLKKYPICSSAGVLGPKRQQGDMQVPEGFYYIDRFNPLSSFHLSLGVNYPNVSDKRKSKAKHLGGDIFIHGSCVTAGCLPMTDELIKEIYLYAVLARNNGQSQVPVYMFPFAMTQENLQKHQADLASNPSLKAFWQNLQQGYQAFEANHQALSVSVDGKGDYLFGTNHK